MKSPFFTHRYDNGLVLVAELMNSVRSAAFTFLTPGGCAYDPANRAGLASFTCEMALRGAGKRDSRQFIVNLDNLGVERGESVTTAHVSYSGAAMAESLPQVLSIYADVLRRPHLPGEQMEASRLAMMQELRAVEDEPSQKVMIELRRRHYPDPWGRSSQGEETALEQTTVDDIRRHFQRCYRPNGTILGVAGRFEWNQLKDLVGELFGDWPQSETPRLVETPVAAKYEHLPYDSQQTHIAIAYPSVPYRDPDYFQAWGAVGVLSGGMSARLFTEVRERRGLCYSIYATQHSLFDRGAVFCYVGVGAERAQEALDVTISELRRLSHGIEDSELDRLKARIKSALIMQQESSSARSSSLARDWYHLDRVRTLDELSRIIDGLTSRSINAYLSSHAPDNFTVVTLGSKALEVPAS